jgi:hypothetical protein
MVRMTWSLGLKRRATLRRTIGIVIASDSLPRRTFPPGEAIGQSENEQGHNALDSERDHTMIEQALTEGGFYDE